MSFLIFINKFIFSSLRIEAVLGAHNIRDNEESSQVRILAENYIIHEEYDSDFNKNDIALVVLPENSVYLSNIIQIVALPSYSDTQNDFLDESSTISGWGKISDAESTYTDLLHYVEAPIITNDECKMWYFGLFIEETNICASGLNGKSPCNGDSGGALLINNIQVGIASFGVGFGCEVDFPGAYTRVTSYLKWIEENSDVIINTI
nr:chymotrypsin BI-like [Onthophagus taurus]